jgi:hypothetical protein
MSSVADVGIVFLAFIVLRAAVLVGLEFIASRPAAFEQLDPVEKNLQRISHSTVYIIALLALKFGSYWRTVVELYVETIGYGQDPCLWVDVILVALLGVSVTRIRTGWRAFRFFNPAFYELTSMLRTRALVKTAAGISGLVYLTPKHDTYIYGGGWLALAYNPLWLIAAWCALIGPIRLFLLRPRQPGGGDNIVDDDIHRQRFDW